MKREWARYTRVSDERGRTGERFHSPDQQNEEIRRKIAELGDREGPLFYDGSVSGGSMDRPEFNRAWAWVMECPRERGIMTLDLSRFGRSDEAAIWYGKLKSAGSDLVTVKEDLSNTLIRSLYIGMAAYQREQIGERYSSIIERRFQRGEHHGTPPVGYRREGETGPLVVDPVLGPVVTEVFARYVRGVSVGSIARYLAAATGNKVSTPAVRRMIDLEVYRGVVTLNGRTRLGKHTALVTDEVWERCRTRRRLAKKTPSRTLQRVHVLAGLVVCGSCGRGLVIRCIKGDRMLVCPGFYTRNGATGARDCPVGVGAPAVAKVEEAVLHHLGQWCLPDDSESSHVEDLRRAVERERGLVADAERRLAQVQATADRLTEDFYDGRIPAERYERVSRSYQEREKREQFSVDTCRSALSAAETALEGVLDGDQRRIIRRVVETWPTADAEHRRRIVESWISHVVVERRPTGTEPLRDHVRPHARAWSRADTNLLKSFEFVQEVLSRGGELDGAVSS